MNIITRLDEYGNVNTDLTEVTVIMTKGEMPPTNYRPLTEAVGGVVIHQADGYSVPAADTAGIRSVNGSPLPSSRSGNVCIIPQNDAQSQE